MSNRKINTKIYKAIYLLAEELLEADRIGDQAAFDGFYAELKVNQTDKAIENLQNAKIAANKSEDKEFKVEIDELLASLLAKQD